MLGVSSILKYYYEPKSNTIDKVNEWVPYRATYTINSDSLNERFDYSINKPEATYRIITLGDSFTFGLYVDTKDNWPEQLEDMLNDKLKCKNIEKFEVINLGVYGYDIQYSTERFKIRGKKYDPDLVIWLIVDFKRMNEKTAPIKIKIEREFNAKGILSEKLKEDNYIVWNLARDELLGSLEEEEIYMYQKTALDDFKKYCHNRLLFVLEPRLTQKEKRLFYEFSKVRGDVFVYEQTQASYPKDSKFPSDGHPNQMGHRVIAQNLFNYLITNKIVPCNF